MSSYASEAKHSIALRIKNFANEIRTRLSCHYSALSFSEYGLQLWKLTLITFKWKKFGNIKTLRSEWFTSCYTWFKILKFLV